MIDEKHDKTVWVDSDQKNLLVLPLYIIGLYSLSKIIVVWAKNSAPIENNMYLYILWGIICIISSWLWFALKEYAEEKNKYSIKYTIIITLITLASIYWNLLTPYIADLIEVIKCVVNQITLKK